MDLQLLTVVLLVAIAVITVVAIAVGMWIALRGRSSVPSAMADGAGPESPGASAVVDKPALRARLGRTRSALASALSGVFGGASVTEETWEGIEEALIAADVGPAASAAVVAEVRAMSPSDGEEARTALESTLVRMLDRDDRELSLTGSPAVVVVVGVNGTGKTTSIAKMAHDLTRRGRSVVLGAADTFRAAADTQLRSWGDRVGVPVVSGQPGSDPASVAYEAYRTARESGADVVIVDTAGRLHSRANLMDELGKIIRVLTRESGGIDETLLVLDGTVGQNGIAQASAFTESAGVTGVVLTKLDGTARGGVAVAIERQLDVPVKLIGVGEQMDDLIPFVPADFVDALVAP